MTHTPGPWHIHNNSSEKHWSMAQVVGPDGHAICSLMPNGKNSERGLSNLNMIAAAPRMYELLRLLVEDPQFSVAIGGNPNMVQGLMDRIHETLEQVRA